MSSPTEVKKEKIQVLEDYDFYIFDKNGNRNHFENFKDKKILINYWATWCPPCIAEMPSLMKLYENKKNDVVFLFITNENPETVANFLTKKGWEMPVYFLSQQPPDLLNYSSLPTTLILNERGEILIRKAGAADWNSKKVREILEN